MSQVDIMQAPAPLSSRPSFHRRLSLSISSKTKSIKHLLTPPSSQSASPASSRTASSNSVAVKHEPPTVFGSLADRYGKAGRILGDGATSEVRIFTSPTDGSVVAVKKFRTDTKEDEKAKAGKVAAEFQIGTSLNHPNIIKVLEIVKERGSWFQVLEFAPIELFEVVESRAMTMEETYCTFGQILKGVKYLHSIGVAHRDLKLENVVMTEDGIMKIIDFGNSMLFRGASTGNKLALARGYIGCEPYMAPEILTGCQYDPRAVDVWSLAILFCRLVLGRFPWEIADSSDYSFKIFSTQAASCSPMDKFSQNLTGPNTLLKELPEECRQTIKGMLQTSPGRRLSLPQVLNNPWIRNLSVCFQDSEGKVHKAEGHEHMVIPPSRSPKLSPTTSRKDVPAEVSQSPKSFSSKVSLVTSLKDVDEEQ